MLTVDRIFTPGLAQVAYIVSDRSTGETAVIDPRRDVDAYVDWANDNHCVITAILETHVHADFVSGSRELALRTNAPIYSSRLGAQEFAHTPLDDGDTIAIGAGYLQALWTPGHTPEHMSFLLFDPESQANPVAMFSGDLLFVGEVGRPDLLGPDHTSQLVSDLYDSIHHRIAGLPDDLVIYPGHTAGSSCGRQIGDAPSTTLGDERRFNYALAPMDRESFIREVLTDMPVPPPYYPVLKRINKVGAPLLDALTAPTLMNAEALANHQSDILVLDVRKTASALSAHVPGSLLAEIGPNFIAQIGWLAPYDRQIVIVADTWDDADQARVELLRIGLDTVSGYFLDGLESWIDASRPVATVPAMSVDALRDRMMRDESLVLLDVRSQSEWNTAHVPGASHLTLAAIASGNVPTLGHESMIALICGTGYRSAFAASLLAREGFRTVVNVTGGMEAWERAGLPVISNGTK